MIIINYTCKEIKFNTDLVHRLALAAKCLIYPGLIAVLLTIKVGSQRFGNKS